MKWTPEELEAMRLADEEIDADEGRLTLDELRAAKELDKVARDANRTNAERAQAGYREKYQQSQKYKDARRRWYLRNREKVKAQTRAYYLVNRDHIREVKADWYQRNKERIRAQQKAHYQTVKAERIAHEN